MNEPMIRKWFDVFKDNHKLTEIRIIDNGRKTFSGYFTNIDTLINAIRPYDRYNIYFTLNVINESCYDREQRDRIVMKPKCTTSDADILAIDWIMVDIDVEKPADTNSTDEEKELAKKVANNVYKYLKDMGFAEPVVCDSANGVHLDYKINMLNNDTNTELRKAFLQVLDILFSTDKVKIDTSTFNASRICKCYGVVSRKGSATSKTRPQRESSIIRVPREIKATPNEYFQKVASYLPKQEQPSRSNNYTKDSFDLDAFIAKHNIAVRNIVETKDYKKYVLEKCPFNESHTAPDSALFVMKGGAIGFRCLHQSDSHFTFKDFRLHYEPDSYTKHDYDEFRQKKNYYGNFKREPFVPIKEQESIGKKWLSMSDIKYVDLESMVAIPTGFEQLDKKIMGLLLGDISVLSGLTGCVDCDTEFFNGKQWKRIADYKEGDMVLQYNADGTSSLVYPKEYVKRPCEKLNYIHTKYGIEQCISDGHRVVYQTSKGNLAIKPFHELKKMHENSKVGFSGKFYTTFKYGGKGVDLTDDEIRLMCAVICDGTFKNGYKDKSICRFNLKKARKKQRLESLLNKMGYDYRKEQYNPKDLGYSNYLVKAPRIEKEFGNFWYDCSNEQLKIICSEILFWDGSISEKRKAFSTSSKLNADFVQFAFSACGYKTTISIRDRVGQKYKNSQYVRKNIEYELIISERNMISMVNAENKVKIEDYKTVDGYKYCFSVDSTMLVLRRNGRINITGNSGKTSWLDCLLLNVVQRGFKTACWSGELQDFRFQGWIDQIAAGKNYVQKKEGYDNFYYAPKPICNKINSWLDNKLFLYNNDYGNNWQQLFNDMKDVVENEGVQLCVLDNLMSLNLSFYDGDKFEKQTKFINDIKEYAKKKNIHIILVAHPRKSTRFLRLQDISGTADLINLCDNLFIIHRVGKDFETRAKEFWGEVVVAQYTQFDSVIEVCKNRSMGVVDYVVGMYFEVESRRLKNSISEHIIYGWQEEPLQQSFIPDESEDVDYFTQLNDSDVPF